jgi:hypothetical protein
MEKKWIARAIQATIMALTIAAILQELEKPKDKRSWHGKLANFIPYDFRIPTLERLKDSYWNRYERHIFTPEVFGVGWAINFYALLENLGVIGRKVVSEADFLMPTQSIKEMLKQSPKTR